MEVNKNRIRLKIESKILSLKHSNKHKDVFYGITEEFELLKINVKQNQIINKWKIDSKSIEINEQLTLILSPKDHFISITNTYGQHGLVYNLDSKSEILALDRKNYKIEHSIFPNCFFSRDSKLYLIHATDWNHIQIFDLEKNENITDRINKYQEEFYLDYFYGELHLSPNQNWILSSGWIWGPASYCKFINLDVWMISNHNEPETNDKHDFSIFSYYWDRAICWISNTSVAYLYDPKEEDLNDEEYSEMKLEKNKSYILIYDIIQSEIIQRIEFNNFSKNEYFEATKDCKIYYLNTFLVISSKLNGISIIDINSNVILYEEKQIQLNNYSNISNAFYNLTDENNIDLITIKN